MPKTLAKKLNILTPPIISQAHDTWRFLCSRIKLRKVGGASIILIVSLLVTPYFAKPITLKASFYSLESLKKEGTYKYSKGVQANGEQFNENALTCASWDFPLKTKLRITTVKAPKKNVIVEVTDRTNKRFKGKRIDLSKRAFSEISNLEQGLCEVFVERIL